MTLHPRQQRLHWCVQRRIWTLECRIVCFKTNFDSVYNTIMVTSVFGSVTVVDTYCQRAFDIVILANHVEWLYRVPLDTRIGYFLFSLTVFWTPVALYFIQVLWNSTFQQDNEKLHVAVLFGPFFIQKMFDCWPRLHVHQIFHQ